MITLPDQPLAERILRALVLREPPAQQLMLFGPPGTGKRHAAREVAWALMDPSGEHPRTAEALDLTEVEATGHQILLRDLEEALAQIAARPSVLARRVMIIHGAERLRDEDGAPRLLKTLEEPPPRSHLILVTDRPSDVLDTIRSRCLPVPFRPPGWRVIARHLEERGLSPEEAAARARAEGPPALTASEFEADMRRIGAELALAALEGAGDPGRRVRELQARMEEAAGASESAELRALRQEAAALEGKRGGRTAAKRAEDQAKRERRRLVSDGWALVMESAAAVAADALAVRLGAQRAVRHVSLSPDLHRVAERLPPELLERVVAEIERARSELELNPATDLAAEALLIRIADARAGRPWALVAPGRLPY